MAMPATAALAGGATYYLRYRAADLGAAADHHAYWASQALALGFALAAATVMLVVCQSLEAVPPRPKTLR
jgi:hypothetical protein